MNIKGYAIPQDAPLIVGLLAQLICMEIRIRRQALPDIVMKIRQETKITPAATEDAAGVMMDKLWRGCGFWLRRAFHSERPCLRRSLVLFRWRVRQGLPVRLLVGVDRRGGDLQGHAWIETPRGPYREDGARLQDYVVMLDYEG